MSSTADRDLPTGTVTFLFTDIEGSTRLLTALGEGYADALDRHNRLLRSAITGHRGTEVGTEGDAFFAVFPSASDAVAAATEVQRALAASADPEAGAVRVRMGLHTGEARRGGDDYVGLDVHRAARIAAAGHGGQVLLSDATRAVVARALPPATGLRDLGEHRLKDLPAPERIWQLDVDGVARDFPPLRSISTRPNNLPPSPTRLIGRDAEVEAIVRLLGRHRLVTLTGPGGTGKTRLAVAVGERLLADAQDGAYFVALEDARDRPMVASAIASALGVREKTDRDLEHGVIEHLRDLDVVLILDNFEQVVGPGAPLVAEFAGGSPRLRVLVTSRTVLHLSAEQEFAVPPLSAPDPDEVVDAATLASFEAVALFVDRARSVDLDFDLDAANALAVARISRRLDGLPLAIELAAARVKVLSPQAILDRLERHLPVLAAGATDLPARQRTLEGAIDWSYGLLEPPERRLFARLAVFAGGWTLESAEAACNVEGELGIDTLEGLASLADKSLIHRTPVADGETRFAMLQVIREYAGAKLDLDPDAAGVRARHARDVLALVETAEPELRRSDLRRWQRRLRREAENVRSALRWAVEHDEAEIGLRIAAAIWDYWHYWAEVREGVGWLETLLARSAVRGPGRVRARGLTALGGLVYWQGNADRVGDLYEEALGIYRRVGSEQEVAAALMNSAWAAAARFDLATGEARAKEALEHFREAGDSASATLVEVWLAMEPVIVGVGGDIQTAIEASGRAVEVSRQVGRAHEAADFLGARALIYRMAGDHQGGIDASQSALTAWYELGNIGRLPLCFKILAAVELAAGHAERAVRLGAAAKRITAEIGGDLAEVFGQLGDPVEEARPFLAPDVHARAEAEGRAMRLDDLVAYALDPDEPGARSA